jgi:hypothetical protein
MDIIKKVRARSVNLSFQHVYKEFNQNVDMSSKYAFTLKEGLMNIDELEGVHLPVKILSIYS